MNFFTEQFKCSNVHAERLAWFVRIAGQLPAVEKPNPWAKHGHVRVYFSLISQNKRPAIDGIRNAYYCANEDDLLIEGALFDRRLPIRPIAQIVNLPNDRFSGAKTRESIKQLCRVFYEQKASRD